MKNFLIFIITLSAAFLVARGINEKLEQATMGSSLEAFKEARMKGMSSGHQKTTPGYDVLVFGDSLLEILFEPIEFDKEMSAANKPTRSWNLALRSMTTKDFKRILSELPKETKFDSCVVQIPALHLSAQKRGSQLVHLWPGRGLSDYLNLWNPLSRQDHGFDSPANLWTGSIARETVPWDESRRGGMNLAESPQLPELRSSLSSPIVRHALNQAYNQIMDLSNFKFDSASVGGFSADVRELNKSCTKMYVLWPMFSPELSDRSIGPDPAELLRLRHELEVQIGLPIHDLPWDAQKVQFLDSQHIDPSYRGDFHKWLAEVI